jgi:predicted ATPase
MIKKITISNFRSLGPDTKIEFEPLTVLVGQNGSGKSNVAKAFQFVADCMQLGLEGAVTKHGGISSLRRWTAKKPYNMAISLEIEEKEFNAKYSFEIGSDKDLDYVVKKEAAFIKYHKTEKLYLFEIEGQQWKKSIENIKPVLKPDALALPLIGGDEKFNPLFTALSKMAVYNIYPDTLRAPKKYNQAKPMLEHGDNWASILKDLDEKEWKDDLTTVLKKLTSEIEDVKIKSFDSYLITEFSHSNEDQKAKTFGASQESDGTLRIAGIITALLQQPALTLIGIEEPELTIHPGAIGLVYDGLIGASRYSQVLVTTHSPELLDLVKRPDAVRVVSKRRNITYVSRIDESQIAIVKEKLATLGELHRTEGLKDMVQSKLEFEA